MADFHNLLEHGLALLTRNKARIDTFLDVAKKVGSAAYAEDQVHDAQSAVDAATLIFLHAVVDDCAIRRTPSPSYISASNHKKQLTGITEVAGMNVCACRDPLRCSSSAFVQLRRIIDAIRPWRSLRGFGWDRTRARVL